MDLIFTTEDQEKFYHTHADATKGNDYSALIYVLGLSDACRRHFAECYDAKNETIKPEALQASWQTGSSRNVTRLAYNLYTWDVIGDSETYAPKALFNGVDRTTREGMLQALDYFA